jgi:hypothetical protein
MHTAESLLPKPSSFKVEITTEKLKIHKSPSTDEILAEMVQAGGNTVHSEIHKLINSIYNKEELPRQWKESIIVPIYRKGDKPNCSNYRGTSLLPTPHNSLSNILFSKLTPYIDKISVNFYVIDQLLIRYSTFVRYWRKSGWSIRGQYISYL